MLEIAVPSTSPPDVKIRHRCSPSTAASSRCAALAVGSYAQVGAAGDILAYERETDGRRFLMVLNLGNEQQTFGAADPNGRIILSTCLDRDGEKVAGALELRGDEGVIVELG